MTKKKKDSIKLVLLILAIIAVIIAMAILTEEKKKRSTIYHDVTTKESGLEIKVRDNIIDNDNNGFISFGDEIILDTEHFYVIKTNEETNTIVMLTKYNLTIDNIDNVLQSSDCLGYKSKKNNKCTIEFSSSNYWETYDQSYPIEVYGESSTIHVYISRYLEFLKSINHPPISGSLLTEEQYKHIINTCLNTSESGECIKPSWLEETTFWTGYAVSSNNIAIISSLDSKEIKFNKVNYAGIRPIIVISAAEI